MGWDGNGTVMGHVGLVVKGDSGFTGALSITRHLVVFQRLLKPNRLSDTRQDELVFTQRFTHC